MLHPNLYQINTRLWIRQFGSGATLADIPDSYWQELADKGIDFIWLMGVWETAQSSIEEYCFHPDLVQHYDDIAPGWKREDVTGSPYAIDAYIPSRLIGSVADLRQARDAIRGAGMKLILDYVPNHFNAHSRLIIDHPQCFLAVDHAPSEDADYYPWAGRTFAHGRDPYFPSWSDTVQIDYFKAETHEFMLAQLLAIAPLCDGVRCDMAMLLLPEIFEQTWQKHRPAEVYGESFWRPTIARVKEDFPQFTFIAEAYWNTGDRLHGEGFDYVYDKYLLDLLTHQSTAEIYGHLQASLSYQSKTVRFIENHDEPRSLHTMGESKSRAASVAFATLPGMRLFYDGQWQGHRIKPPVQLSRMPAEQSCPCTIAAALPRVPGIYCACQHQHYACLLDAVKDPLFQTGNWTLLPQHGDLLAWQWQRDKDHRLVLINYSSQDIDMRLPMDWLPSTDSPMVDLLQGDGGDLPISHQAGTWRLRLPGFKSSILAFSKREA